MGYTTNVRTTLVAPYAVAQPISPSRKGALLATMPTA
jgi:hypothetical protein